MSSADSPLGLFDSGVGGLSVLRAVAHELPHEDLLYVADQKYCPYGPRPPEEIRALSQRIVEFLLSQDCKAIVVACNTASAAALAHLRTTFPEIPFVGMEPAVKPAARNSQTKTVGVLATQATLQGDLFARTRAEHAGDVEVLIEYPPDWVERVERGEVDTEETKASVEQVLRPFMEAGADEIALGCTHYPFLMPVIEQVTRGRVTIIDPSQAVARQTAHVLTERSLLNPKTEPGKRIYYTSGDPLDFGRVLGKLLDEKGEIREFFDKPFQK